MDPEGLKERKREYNRRYRLAHLEDESARGRAYYEANRDKELARDHAYHAANREKRNAACRVYNEANREKLKADGRAYYLANRERIIAQARTYREANREKLRAAQRRYMEVHRDRVLDYRAANRETVNAAIRAWRKAHPKRWTELARAGAGQRRALKVAAEGYASPDQIKARWAMWGDRCWICGAPATCTDHVKPLQPRPGFTGGSNWPANLRPACTSCNSRKHNHWPWVVAA